MLIAAALLGGLVTCGESSNTYALYRASPTDANMRIHIATFNAEQNEAYNRENCDVAAKLFQSQPGVSVRYWCEKGAFRK
jgi:hypothetical protein